MSWTKNIPVAKRLDCVSVANDVFTQAERKLSHVERTGLDRERICNIAGGAENAMSLLELSHWCDDRFGMRQVVADFQERPFDIPWVVLDSRRAAALWNWTPARKLPSILEEIAQHAETNPDWLKLSEG